MIFTLLTSLAIATHSDGLPAKAPKAVGMSKTRLEVIDRVIQRGIKAGGYPGAAVVVGRRGAAVVEKGYGRLGWGRESDRVSPQRTVYDLASLTKVVGTTTAIMVLYDQGRIALDAPVSTYLPAFAGGDKDSVTVRLLLEHRSGLPAGRELWRTARNPQEARLQVIDAPLECKPGACYIYSDLGADILGMIVENVTGQGLDQFLEERVFQPLGMTDTRFLPPDSMDYRVAPTEVTSSRGYTLRGEVHDENAWVMGGVAGHAGLFSTAADLSVFGQMLLNGGEYQGVRIVSDSTVRLFTRRAAGVRALGWNMCDGDFSCGRYFSDAAFGHTGFTGTSMWIDPDRELFVILLTNRVHAARARRPSKVIADVRADLADAAAASVTDDPEGLIAMPVRFRADRAVGWNRPVRHAHAKKKHRKSPAPKRPAVKFAAVPASAKRPVVGGHVVSSAARPAVAAAPVHRPPHSH